MKKLIVILICMCFSTSILAVERIQQGEPSPVTGYVFSLEDEIANRIELIEGEGFEKKLQITQEMLDRYKEAYQEADEQLAKKIDRSKWTRVGYFLMGMGLAYTSAMAWGEVSK